jgi:hypothetical protein
MTPQQRGAYQAMAREVQSVTRGWTENGPWRLLEDEMGDTSVPIATVKTWLAEIDREVEVALDMHRPEASNESEAQR